MTRAATPTPITDAERSKVAGLPAAAKVPAIGVMFWTVKLLTTGIGEACSDFMGQNSVPIAALVGVGGTAIAFRLQYRRRGYHAPTYWFAVLMVAVFGTMVADGIKDGAGLSYSVTTPCFAIAVAAVFAAWYRAEGTLSIHSITTRRREHFYWLAVLATFALGTAAGDLTAIELHLGYFPSAALFAALVAYLARVRSDIQDPAEAHAYDHAPFPRAEHLHEQVHAHDPRAATELS